jgi:hypothetical protein
MEKRRDKAIDSVEIFDHSVRCQKCHNVVPITGSLPRPKNSRIPLLQARLNWMQRYRKHGHGNTVTKDEDIKAVRAELSELLQDEEDSRADKCRSIPLHYWRGKYMCGNC